MTRVFLVTGATSGLGLAMTLALLESGYRIAAIGRNATALDELAATASEGGFGDQLLALSADIRDADACARAVDAAQKRFGQIDGLINNAGANVSAQYGKRFYDVPPDVWREVIDTNLNGAFYMTTLVGPLLVERGWGRILNHVTSFGTMVRGGYTPYGPSKAALEAATVAWADELKGTGVTVNAILPGSAADTRRMPHHDGEDRSALVPPSAMIEPVRWLLSDDAGGVTGMRVAAKLWSAERTITENIGNAVSSAWHER